METPEVISRRTMDVSFSSIAANNGLGGDLVQSAPLERRRLMTGSCIAKQALCNAACPSVVLASMDAPWDSSDCTSNVWPDAAAEISGVWLWGFRDSMSTPSERS